MHMSNRSFGVWRVHVDNVGGASVGHDYARQLHGVSFGGRERTLPIHWQVKLANDAIGTENFS